MDQQAMPILKLEIERLSHTINSMLGIHGSELGEMLQVSVEKAVASYDMDAKVNDVVKRCVDSQIENYFKFGPGAKAIKAMIDSSFGELDG